MFGLGVASALMSVFFHRRRWPGALLIFLTAIALLAPELDLLSMVSTAFRGLLITWVAARILFPHTGRHGMHASPRSAAVGE
jgi:hypothetical protein